MISGSGRSATKSATGEPTDEWYMIHVALAVPSAGEVRGTGAACLNSSSFASYA